MASTHGCTNTRWMQLRASNSIHALYSLQGSGNAASCTSASPLGVAVPSCSVATLARTVTGARVDEQEYQGITANCKKNSCPASGAGALADDAHRGGGGVEIAHLPTRSAIALRQGRHAIHPRRHRFENWLPNVIGWMAVASILQIAFAADLRYGDAFDSFLRYCQMYATRLYTVQQRLSPTITRCSRLRLVHVYRPLKDKRLAANAGLTGIDLDAPPWAAGPFDCSRVMRQACAAADPRWRAQMCSSRPESAQGQLAGGSIPRPGAVPVRGDLDGYVRTFQWYVCIDGAAADAGIAVPAWCRGDSAAPSEHDDARPPLVCLETRHREMTHRATCTCWLWRDTTGLSEPAVGAGTPRTISDEFPLDRRFVTVTASQDYSGDPSDYFGRWKDHMVLDEEPI